MRNDNKKKALPVNLIMANLYEQEPTLLQGKCSARSGSTYYELQVIEDGKGGAREEFVEVAYPITPDYVKSFEQSANYKNDVDGAIANGSKGANLGNVVDMQELYAMDSSAIADLADKLKKASAVVAQAQKAEKAVVKKENNEEVDNG